MGVPRGARRARPGRGRRTRVRLLPDRAAQDVPADPVDVHVRPQRLAARVDPRRGRPHDHPVRPDARVAPRRRDRGRGPRLLPAPRHRSRRHPSRRVDRPREARDRAGRLHDHAAARQAGVRGQLRRPAGRDPGLRGAASNDQGEDPRGAPGDQARADAVEGPDPGPLPQHHLSGTRRVRRPGGGADVLGRRRRRPDRQAVGDARRSHHVAGALRSDRPSRGLRGPPQLRARPDGALRLPRRRDRRPPEDEEGDDGSEEGGRELAGQLRVLRGLRQALPDQQVRGRGGLRRRLPRDDLARPRVAARGGGGGQRAPAEPVRPGGGVGRDRSEDRSDPGDGGRSRVQPVAGEPGGVGTKAQDRDVRGHRTPGGFIVQAVHAGRRHEGGLQPRRELDRAGDDHDPQHRLLHERGAVDAVERLGLRGGACSP